MCVAHHMGTPPLPWHCPEPVVQAWERSVGWGVTVYRPCHGHLRIAQGNLVVFKVPSSPNLSMRQPQTCTSISASCAALLHRWICRHFSFSSVQSVEKFRIRGCLTAYSVTAYRIKKCEQSSLGYLHSFSKDTGPVFSWSEFMLSQSFTSIR